MSVLAVSTGVAVLAWIGLAAGLAVLAVVIVLFRRIMRPAREIDAYAKDIRAAAAGIATNLEGAEQLTATRSLGGAVPGLAAAYLRKLGLVR